MGYLTPGVYVEEIPSGNNAIEGVSTSTAGMVGVTQRGPANIPTLVTSFGEFKRIFGDLLDHRTYTDGRDALPYAAQGFFSNGGQRVYISRIVGPGATFAETDIFAEVTDSQLTMRQVRRTIRSANVVKPIPLLRVSARSQGVWGNQLRARIHQTSLLNTVVTTNAKKGSKVVVFETVSGLSVGSYVRCSSAGAVLTTIVVSAVNHVANEVTLATPLPVAIPASAKAVSLEYKLIIERLEKEKVVESEVFEHLGLHPRHARYGPKIVGTFRRDSQLSLVSGESQLVCLCDLTVADGDTVLRDDVIVSGASLPALATVRQFVNGMDDVENIDDAAYIGTFSDNPCLRTGVQSLENEESVSLVAVPGRTSVRVQKALTEHCEKMRYRFAVLETPRSSTVRQATIHRQSFDTTRAAIYYPWLLLADPFSVTNGLLAIPPSGHIMGVYVRTDTNRGVWKASANEEVNGVLQFETSITSSEQDILNPLGINVLRDFRATNRGLRIWGARTLSSDPEWKYVNVRRLLLFVEHSIHHGMQFVALEPNAANLWVKVRQLITSFLIMLWRSGALAGAKPEEAFFVNVGYKLTMTRADIDNGRLIVEVGVAPMRPAEFVIIRITQKTSEAPSRVL